MQAGHCREWERRMAKEVTVHAVYLQDSTMIHAFNLRQGGADLLPTGHTGIPKGYSPQKIIDKILAAANGGRIKILRLLAHGDAGEFDFPGVEDRSSVSSKYAQLRKAFAPMARIEIHGCGCASEKKLDHDIGKYSGDPKGRGLRFLWAVAQTFNVPVTGAVDSQGNWDGWGYSGVTVTISPAGKFYAEKPGQRWWDPSSADAEAKAEFYRIKKLYIDKKLYVDARIALRVLMANYPTSEAAGWAAQLVPLGAIENPDRGLVKEWSEN